MGGTWSFRPIASSPPTSLPWSFHSTASSPESGSRFTPKYLPVCPLGFTTLVAVTKKNPKKKKKWNAKNSTEKGRVDSKTESCCIIRKKLGFFRENMNATENFFSVGLFQKRKTKECQNAREKGDITP